MGITADRNDPALQNVGSDGMQEKYLVLSEEERAKGFVRPVRYKYIHVGVGGSEIDPNDISKSGLKGNGCGVLTVMGKELSETYARDPKFYGATYCVGCKTHYPVGENGEFVWADTDIRVGA